MKALCKGVLLSLFAYSLYVKEAFLEGTRKMPSISDLPNLS